MTMATRTKSTVRRVPTAAKPRTVAPKPKGRSQPREDIPLPDGPQEPSTDIRHYSILLYGPPKIGKTTFFSTFPEPLFLCTELGAEGLAIHNYNADGGGVHSWPIMEQAVKKLEASDRYQNVVIDTLDEAQRICQDHVCKMAGVEHPTDAEDFGKTWQALTNTFVGIFRRLKQTGRGVYMTSHAQESMVQTASGSRYNKIGPSLTGKTGAKLLALADFIFYMDHYRVDGKDVRAVCTDGNELIVGGHRKIGGRKIGMPQFIALPEDESQDYEVFAAAFRGEVEGIDPAKIMPSKATTATGAEAVKTARMEELGKRRKGATGRG